MKETYLKSLQMIKRLNIKSEKQYNKLLHNYLILNAESLKYISQTRSFRKIIQLAKEVAQTSFTFINKNSTFIKKHVISSYAILK